MIGECERNAESADWAYAVIFSDAAYWLSTLVAELRDAQSMSYSGMVTRLLQRAEAAEAGRDEARQACSDAHVAAMDLEAERDTLKAALEEVVEADTTGYGTEIARAALAAVSPGEKR